MKARIRRLPFIFYCCMVLFLLFAFKAQAQQSRQVLHSHVRPVVSQGQAKLISSLPSNEQLHLSIVLPLRNQAELRSLLNQLYDPSSHDYRQFLSVQQFAEQFSPTIEDYQAVVEFAKNNGFTVTNTPANRLIVPVIGTAAQVEEAFNVKMNVYQHPTESRTFFSPDREPALDLSVPVLHIAGLNNYSLPRAALAKASVKHGIATATGSGPYGYFIGSDMRAAYYGGSYLTGAGQAVGLFEIGGYNTSDVNESFSSAQESNSVPVNNVLVDGAGSGPISCNNDPPTDDEQVLDIVAAIGMAPGLSQVRVYIGPCNDDSGILNKMASENTAKVVSISWVWSPDDPGTDDGIFEEMAAQGQSIFAASGDWGSYPVQDPKYRAYFPAEDANVTAVGGTSLQTQYANGPWKSEIAWGTGYCTGYCASGGGVSPDGITIPGWQAGVANSNNGGSATLRNVPDVAMEAADGFYICALGQCGGYIGTSLATPLWAGYMALVNQQAVAGGNAPQGGLGFINREIYSIGKGSDYNTYFHDITTGSNGRYSAVAGYDLVTGWGSPNGQGMLDALSGVSPTFSITASGTVSTYLPANTVSMGHSIYYGVSVNSLYGFAGLVNLSASGLPAGVIASFSPASVYVSPSAPGSAYLLITAGYGAGASPPPPSPVTIYGASVSPASFNSTTFTLTPRAMQYKGACGVSSSISQLPYPYTPSGWINYPNMP